MKKTIRRTFKKHFNIRTLFHVLQFVFTCVAVYIIEHETGISDKQSIIAFVKSLSWLVAACALQPLGAVVTRILYHFGLLKRRNVMVFFHEAF